MFACHACGYRYLLVKQDGEKKLVNFGEKTHSQPPPALRLKKRIGGN
jgi:hypothetical protein